MNLFDSISGPTIIMGVLLILGLMLYGKLRPMFQDMAGRIRHEERQIAAVAKHGEAITELAATLGTLRMEITALREEVREMKLESNKSHAAILERMARLEAYAEDNGHKPAPKRNVRK